MVIAGTAMKDHPLYPAFCAWLQRQHWGGGVQPDPFQLWCAWIDAYELGRRAAV